MKRTNLILLCIIAIQQTVSAQMLTDQSVRNIAANWLKEHSGKDYTPETSRYLKADSSLSLVQMADGWVIINTAGSAYPVVAYSAQGHYDVASHQIALDTKVCAAGNENVTDFVGTYSRSPKKFVPRKTRAPRVAPLLTTRWSQDEPYDGMLPIDPLTSERSAAGCGPTAGAQVLNYHKFPTKAYGSNAYTPAQNQYIGELSVNFAEQTYGYSTEADIQKLYFHLGVAVNAEYASAATSSSLSALCHALVKYFSYDAATCRLVERKDFSNEEWFALITSNLDQSLPIVYAGSDPAHSGHGFVIDGYENEHFVDVNWGWGGKNNGYYSIYALEPSDRDYTQNNQMIIGIKPNISPVFKPDLALVAKQMGGGPIVLGSSNAFVSSEDTISDTDTAYIKFSLANFGAADQETPAEIQILVNGVDVYRGSYKTLKMKIGTTYPYSFTLPVKLKAGDNTVSVNLDPKNALDELNETNNSFTERIFVKKGFAAADLHFAQTIIMGDSLVISNLADLRETADNLASNAPLYCSFAVQNTGNVDMKSLVEVNGYLDGVLFAEKTTSGKLVNGTISKFESLALPTVTEGKHQLKIVIDPNKKIAEIDESNNTIIREFTAKVALIIDKANLTFVSCGYGYDTVVISQATDATLSLDTLPAGSSVKFTACLGNNGLETAPEFNFKYTLNRNNVYYNSNTMHYPATVLPNGEAAFRNILIGNLKAGNYELQLIADVINDVDEYYENDNVRTVKFTVIDALPQASLPAGAATAAQGTTASYATSPIAGAAGYTWTLVPASAGTLTSNGASASITWSPSYTGTASLTVSAFNGSIAGDASAPKSVNVSAQPAPEISLQTSTATLAGAANSTVTIQVGSNTSWTAASDLSWLTLTPATATTGDGSFVITAAANTATKARTATITITAAGAAPKTVTVTQQPALISGINELANEISLYPNPAADEIFIGNTGRATVQMFDTKGQLVLSAETAGNQPVNIQTLPKGTYTVKISAIDRSATVILQKE